MNTTKINDHSTIVTRFHCLKIKLWWIPLRDVKNIDLKYYAEIAFQYLQQTQTSY